MLEMAGYSHKSVQCGITGPEIYMKREQRRDLFNGANGVVNV